MSTLQSYNWKKISQKFLFLSIKRDYGLIETQIRYICSKSISLEMLCKIPQSWNASQRTDNKKIIIKYYNQAVLIKVTILENSLKL